MTSGRGLRLSLERPVLCLVVDRSCSSFPILDAIEAAVAGGVDWVQIRERDIESAELLAQALQMKGAAERGAFGRSVRVLVNRRVDIALAAGAAGVHLGFDAMSVDDARVLLPEDSLVGCSAHSADEVKGARKAGIDYAHLAPIFAPLSKPATRPALGLDALREASSHSVRVLAQGGVEVEHCRGVLEAGASGIAVTGSILMSRDPGAAAKALRHALDAAVPAGFCTA